MALVKIVFCLIALGLAHSEDVVLKTPQEKSLVQPLSLSKETRATVLDTNLASSTANAIANDIQQVYNTVSGALNRAIAIKNTLNGRYPYYSNNAVINYQAISFYQRYYVIVSVNGDVVLGFGL